MSQRESARSHPGFEQFDDIASLYDELMTGVPYKSWVDYVQRIVTRFSVRPGSVLDLCCGTGSVSFLLARKGYKVVGVDISPGMISVAQERARTEHADIRFHVQDAAELSLPDRFELVISLFDSLNYILDPDSLRSAFHRVAEHLRPGGLFIFDLNAELALAAGFFDQDNLGSGMPLQYVWRSSYDPGSRICRIKMVFDQKVGDKCRRTEVEHVQRAYEQEEILEMLAEAGLTILAVYDAYSFRDASRRSDRVFFVAVKPASREHSR